MWGERFSADNRCALGDAQVFVRQCMARTALASISHSRGRQGAAVPVTTWLQSPPHTLVHYIDDFETEPSWLPLPATWTAGRKTGSVWHLLRVLAFRSKALRDMGDIWIDEDVAFEDHCRWLADCGLLSVGN